MCLGRNLLYLVYLTTFSIAQFEEHVYWFNTHHLLPFKVFILVAHCRKTALGLVS